jgi:hypothetical protein
VRRLYFLFLDGVGLGEEDPARNPLFAAQRAGLLPTLDGLLDGAPLARATGRLSTATSELLPVDAQMGIPGRPQSATGQAALITGVNAPARLGEHYGPRPDDRVRAVIDEGTIFSRLKAAGLHTWFVNAYPERFFETVQRGKRLLSAIPYAVTQAGQPLPTYDDLAAGRALSADFTGEGWRSELGYSDAPVYSPFEAGEALARIGLSTHLTFFEHWLTDLLGHDQAHVRAIDNFARIDGVLAGLLVALDAAGALEESLIVLAADHGNVEETSHSRHTENPALGLLLGATTAQRKAIAGRIHALSDLAAPLEDFLQPTAAHHPAAPPDESAVLSPSAE